MISFRPLTVGPNVGSSNRDGSCREPQTPLRTSSWRQGWSVTRACELTFRVGTLAVSVTGVDAETVAGGV